MAYVRDVRRQIEVSRSVERMDGTACVDGTRLSVVGVLNALRSSQVIVKYLQRFYPTLTGRQIDAALRFAHDEVERSDDAWIRRERRKERTKKFLEELEKPKARKTTKRKKG